MNQDQQLRIVSATPMGVFRMVTPDARHVPYRSEQKFHCTLSDGLSGELWLSSDFCVTATQHTNFDEWFATTDGNPSFQDCFAAGLNAQREQHPDDAAVDRFAAAMKEKLASAREKGRSGWETCPVEWLQGGLVRHVIKGDPRDVANFCMMLWNRGDRTKIEDQWVYDLFGVWPIGTAQREQPAAALPAVDDRVSYRTDYPTSESVLGEQIAKAKEDQRLFGVGFTVGGWHVPAQLVACWGMSKAERPAGQPAAHPKSVVLEAAGQLVDLAEGLGQVVTIERTPLYPLAMGHAEYRVSVREKRVRS